MLRDLKQRIKRIPYNFIIDNLVTALSFDELGQLENVKLEHYHVKGDDYKKWVYTYFPKWRRQFKNIQHKKLIEFYVSFSLLSPKDDDLFLDAAGGHDTYINNLRCSKRYIHDIRISEELKASLVPGIECIQSSAGKIPLADESIDKIACHHSFEHFQDEIDILFLKEAQRLLKPGGKCCIIPVFIADRYVEVTDNFTFDKKYDFESERIIDPMSLLPGGDGAGNYARIYDLNAFRRRVINNIDSKRFKPSIIELDMDGRPVPDLGLKCHAHATRINYPYRALFIERLTRPNKESLNQDFNKY